MNEQPTTTVTERILLVEDDPAFARLVQARLNKALTNGQIKWVENLASAQTHCLAASVDVLVLDLNLPDSEGVATVRRMYEACPTIPIIVLTGTDDDEAAIRALKAGAQDYVRKDEVSGSALGRSIRYAIERNCVARLEHERHRLQDAVSALEHVIAVIGHELRTPIAGIRGILEHLLDGKSHAEEETKRFLDLMHGESLQLAHTLNNLLEAARLDSGSARWNWNAFELAPVMESAVESVHSYGGSESVPIHISIDGPQPTMRGDSDAVRRLIVNLLTNSLKHTIEGRIDVLVTPAPGSNGRMVRLVVSDSGCGMSVDVAERLGTAFALNSGIVGASHTAGTGLGMAICKGIAAAHGGRIVVQTRQGEGTTVTVDLRTDLPGPITSPAETKVLVETGRSQVSAFKRQALPVEKS